MTNLEVDVMEGDRFVEAVDGGIFQYRNGKGRHVAFRKVIGWEIDDGDARDMPLDLATFTRYCEGCGLTVKQVKPEPKVETIKPPEWAIRWEDGRREMFDDEPSATVFLVESRRAGRVVRIDWGAKSNG